MGPHNIYIGGILAWVHIIYIYRGNTRMGPHNIYIGGILAWIHIIYI